MSYTREELEKTGLKQPESIMEVKKEYIREQLERAFLPAGRKEQNAKKRSANIRARNTVRKNN